MPVFRALSFDSSYRIFTYLSCSGIVEEADPGDSTFSVGDRIIGTWSLFGIGGMAEYAIVTTALAAPAPPSLSDAEASGLVNSSVHGLLLVEKAAVKRGDRVLVLGGSGGVGSAALQLARDAGAGYIAATSTDAELMVELGVDRAVDYREENFWEVPEFAAEKFDVVLDCAVGEEAWKVAGNVLKPGREGGRFLAVVFNQWVLILQHVWQAPSIFTGALSRMIGSGFANALPFGAASKKPPKYSIYLGEPDGESIRKVCALVEEKRLRVVLDQRSPFPFSERGVKDAFNLLVNRKGHGKIVVGMT